ncbi:ferric-dicitrate binding protein FerR (iron transport regulator) [Xanthomonas translucens]
MAVNAPRHRSRFAPWAALLAAMAGEALHQQLLADLLRFRCEWGSGLLGAALAAAVLALMAIGCWVSWRSLPHRAAGDDAGTAPIASNRRFIVHLGWMTAALLAVAVLWQTLATWLVPSCP